MSYFTAVRDAFATAAKTNLERMGVNVKAGPKGDWLQVLCPVCADTSGSASISHTSGFLKCHQCGAKQDLFQWWSEKHGTNDWESCKALAQLFGVHISDRTFVKVPRSMTKNILREATHNLLDSPIGEVHRQFLMKRKLWHPQLLEQFGVGVLGDSLVLAQWDNDGKLRPRYRKYGAGKWLWSGGSGTTLGFWPYYGNLMEGDKIFLLEGEWDVKTAWMRLMLQHRGMFAFTWTGGAGSPIPPHMIPEAWRGKDVHIIYDNDTFQGDKLEDYWAPDQKKHTEMLRRHTNLLDRVAKPFYANKCTVVLRKIPLDPREFWGGDLRDWVDQGGDDVMSLPSFSYSRMLDHSIPVEECSYGDVFAMANKGVRFEAQVSTVEEEVINVPAISELVCPMGTKACCGQCDGPNIAPAGVIHWKDHPAVLAEALCQFNFERFLIYEFIAKPKGCNKCRIKTVEYEVGSRWRAMEKEGNDESRKTISIISKQEPTLSGDVTVEGMVFHNGKDLVVFADKMECSDNLEVDLDAYHNDLLQICPSQTNDVSVLNDYIRMRAQDMGNNVTHIYGRDDMHIAIDIAAHSVSRFIYEYHKRRGWMDISIIGDTRTGKSECVKHMMQHHGLGQSFTCVQNLSRAGLTMGAVGKGEQMKPGLFPRNHRKMLALDEFHLMLESRQSYKDHPLLHLQNARDAGRVEGVKIYGAQSLLAEVRLVTVGNWAKSKEETYRFACQHLLALYGGAPECLSRLDFGLAIRDVDEDDLVQLEVEHHWNRDMTRAMILRAWAMEAEQVHIDQEVVDYAKQKCKEWKYGYAEELPLFTQAEKFYSILRISIAAANLSYSYRPGDIYSCHVRRVHAEWACEWLEMTWKNLAYDLYSARVISSRELKKPFEIEALLTVELRLKDPEEASTVINQLFGANSSGSLLNLYGGDRIEFDRWIGRIIRLGLLESDRSGNTYHMEIKPTKGGNQFLHNLVMLAEDYPEIYVQRFQKLHTWARQLDLGHPPKGMVPLNRPPTNLRVAWDNALSDRKSNVIDYPGGSA